MAKVTINTADITGNLNRANMDAIRNNFISLRNVLNDNYDLFTIHQTTQAGAHTAKQIKVNDIYTVADNLEWLQALIDNLVIGANGDGIAEVKEARVSIYDKKAYSTLNSRLKVDFEGFTKDLASFKNDIKQDIADVKAIDNRFETRTDRFNYLMTLQANDPHVMQTFYIGSGKDVFQTQANGDDFIFSHKNQNGEQVSTSTVENGGHGTQIGYADGYFYSNMRATDGNFKLVRFKYKPGGIVKYTDPETEDVFVGENKGLYVNPTIDAVNDIIVFRIGTGTDTPVKIEVRQLSEVLNKVDKVLYSFTIPQSLSNDTQPMQGIEYDHDTKTLYWLTGTSDPNQTTYLTAFDATTGKQAWQRTVAISTYYTAGGFMEPEGMQLWRSPDTAKKALLIGYSTGLANDRKHLLFGVFQRGVLEELKGAQFGASGRVDALPVDATKLTQITKVGRYYMTTDQAMKLTDFPIPIIQESGWYLNVYEKSGANGNMRQEMIRNSYARTALVLDRSIDPNNKEYGVWNLTPKYSEGADRPPASVKKLADLAFAGLNWYMSSDDSKRMTDFPRNDGISGWFIEHSASGTDNVVVQKVTRNSNSHYMEIYARTIATDTKQAGQWSLFKSELV